MSRTNVAILVFATLAVAGVLLFPPWAAMQTVPEEESGPPSVERVGPLRWSVFSPPPAPTEKRADGLPKMGPYVLDWPRTAMWVWSVLLVAGLTARFIGVRRKQDVFDGCVAILMAIAFAMIVFGVVGAVWVLLR